MPIFRLPSRPPRLKGFLLADALVGTVILVLLAVAVVQAIHVSRIAINRQEVQFGNELAQRAATTGTIQTYR